MDGQIMVKMEKISKAFFRDRKKPHKILKDISLSIKKGETFVLIGPNGSGKTTLLRIIGLLDKPDEGKYFLKDSPINFTRKKELVQARKIMAFVRQKPVVRDTTVYKNLIYGLHVRNIPENEIKRRLDKYVKLFRLEKILQKNARKLSGGEMQRVAIAMNLILEPELYLLDEISANLDHENQSLLSSVIKTIKENPENTLIIATHDRFEAIRYADRIGVIYNGELIQVGTPEEIFSRPKHLFTAQFIGYENILHGTGEYDEEKHIGLVQIPKMKNKTVYIADRVEGEATLCIRPESIALSINPPEGVSFRNIFRARIAEISNTGTIAYITLKVEEQEFVAIVTHSALESLELRENAGVYLTFKATDIKKI